jgi:S-(hydroxymethyl)glutathione dehydrogenase/alcohol dehydrogenase
MKAAVVYESKADIAIADVDLGKLGEEDVLVRIEASGLCHTDVAVRDGSFPVPLPVVIGHEGAGVVEEVGSRVTSVAPGDHVLLAAAISCGRCAQCAKGLPNLCRTGFKTTVGGLHPDGEPRMIDGSGHGLHQFACLGTLAERLIALEGSVIKIREDVPLDVASLVGCAVVTGLGVVFHRARPRQGNTSVVVGCGGIGLCVVQGARIAGASRIIAVDPVEEKRQLALEFGATDTIDPGAGNSVEQVLEATDGDGGDYVYEAVGIPAIVRQAWDMAAVDGTIVAIGVHPAGSEVALPAGELYMTEKTLMSCVYGTSRPRQDMPLYLDMYMNGQLNLDPLISKRYGLQDINSAIEDLEAGRIHGRGIFSMR